MRETSQPLHTTVDWHRVLTFYGLALCGPLTAALVIVVTANRLTVDSVTEVGQLSAALLAMPAPLLAGLWVEHRAGHGTLLRGVLPTIRAHIGSIALVTVTVTFAIYAVMLGLAVLAGNVLNLAGAGHLTGVSGLPPVPDSAVIPLLALTPLGAITAGATINGLFAFGEEYGWRGVLAQELRPLGSTRANLVTGVAWGLWHAPLVILGHNYGDDWVPGIAMMVLFTTTSAFVLDWARRRTGSLVACATLHGAINFMPAAFLVGFVGTTPLFRPPAGFLGVLGVAMVAVLLWRVFPPASDSVVDGALPGRDTDAEHPAMRTPSA